MSDLVSWLLTVNLQAAVMVAVLLGVRKILGNRVPASAFCLGWVIVAVRLLVPAIPHSTVSVYGVGNLRPSGGFPVLPLGDAPGAVAHVQGTLPAATMSTVSIATVITVAWLAGVCVSLLLFLRAWRRGLVLDARPSTDPTLLALVRDVSRAAGLSRVPAVRITAQNVSPSVVGLIRPHLILPRSFTLLSDVDQRCIVLHECAHLRRRDLLSAAVARLAAAVHWFNPFAWIALRALRHDRELACDELAMGWLAQDEREVYGSSLIAVLRQVSSGHPTSACAVDVKNSLARRFRAIAAFRGRRLLHVAVACIAVCGLGFSTLSAPRFEDASPHALDLGQWFMTGLGRQQCSVTPDDQVRWNGAPSLRLEPDVTEDRKYCTFMMMSPADSYRGKRVRFSALVRGEGISGRGDAWFRVQGTDSAADGFGLASGKCPLSGTFDWTPCEIVVDVAAGGQNLQGGIGLGGAGRLWIAHASLTPVDRDVTTTPVPARYGALDTFEDGRHMWTMVNGDEYVLAVDGSNRHGGQNSGRLAPRVASPRGVGGVGMRLLAAGYRRHRVRVVMWVRGDAVERGGEVWARVDGADPAMPMPTSARGLCPFTGLFEWRDCEVALDVPEGAESIQLGVSLHGPGTVWFDDVSIERP